MRIVAIVMFAVWVFGISNPLSAAEPVALRPQPGTPLDATVRELVQDDLAQAAQKGDAPLVLIGETKLGSAKEGPALFVQLQSARECGSAGCNTRVYLQRDSKWVPVLDSVGGTIKVDNARHGGMHDLLVGGDGRWVWNGKKYVDTTTAPEVNLKPR